MQKKHFREIIGRRANLDWNEHDISTAVVLAEMMALCQQQQVILARELEENPEEDPNPQRLKLISESSSKIIQFRRTLNIHQPVVDTRHFGKHNDVRRMSKHRTWYGSRTTEQTDQTYLLSVADAA